MKGMHRQPRGQRVALAEAVITFSFRITEGNLKLKASVDLGPIAEVKDWKASVAKTSIAISIIEDTISIIINEEMALNLGIPASEEELAHIRLLSTSSDGLELQNIQLSNIKIGNQIISRRDVDCKKAVRISRNDHCRPVTIAKI